MLLTCTLKIQQLGKHVKLGSTQNYVPRETMFHAKLACELLYEKFCVRAKLFYLREKYISSFKNFKNKTSKLTFLAF